ncbi:MAG: glycosyltransferase, partial [Campylobacterales bacterium]|nr:glycosyltransferase [Campylobacterales bacterium]
MKIVHVANYEFRQDGRAYYNMDYKIHQGLVRNNHFVFPFSLNDFARWHSVFKSKKFGKNKVNKKLIDICKNIKPDLLLLGHADLINSATLKEIKLIIPTIKIAKWFVDALFYESNINPIKAKISYIDTFFATTGGELLNQFEIGKTKAFYMPNMVDDSIEIYKNFESGNLPIDFLFCGTDRGDQERRVFLTSLQKELSFLKHKFVGSLGNAPLFAHEYIETLSQAKMALNYSRRNDVELYSSDRIAQLTGNGILTFTPRIPRFEELYSDKEVVYFDDLQDLISKIKYYHNHHKEAKEIAYNGWLKSHKKYNSTVVTK